jgi:hypothetical protein
MTLRQLRTTALAAALLAGTAGIAFAQQGTEGATSPGGAVTEGPGRAGNAGMGRSTPSAVTGTDQTTTMGKRVKTRKTARRHTGQTTGSGRSPQ